LLIALLTKDGNTDNISSSKKILEGNTVQKYTTNPYSSLLQPIIIPPSRIPQIILLESTDEETKEMSRRRNDPKEVYLEAIEQSIKNTYGLTPYEKAVLGVLGYSEI
jgi:hypothetical protein